MTKTMMIALASATIISTSANAGNQLSPATEPPVVVLPEMDMDTGSLASSGGNSGVVLGILGLLVIGGIASSGGS